MKKQAGAAFDAVESTTFRRLLIEFGLKRVRQLDSVQSAELKFQETAAGGQVAVAIFVSPLEEAEIVSEKAEGMLTTGDFRDFPTIFRNERSKFAFILNGGVGVFNETDPCFGGYGDAFNGSNPTAEDPLGSGTSTWVEEYVEPGFDIFFQLSDCPLYSCAGCFAVSSKYL